MWAALSAELGRCVSTIFAMKKVSAILATTHVDRHNEAFAVSALEGMVESLNRSYLPVGVEHDPRVPPIGRVISAEVRKRDDGEFEVAAEIEMFEPGDRVSFVEEGVRPSFVTTKANQSQSSTIGPFLAPTIRP